MKLYELSETYRNLSEFLSQDNGEAIYNEEQFKAQLASITEQLNIKAENIGKLVLTMQSDSEAISKEIERLTNRKRIIDNKVEWLKDYLRIEMQNANKEKIEGQVLTLTLTKCQPSVIIVDKNKIPLIFRRIIPETWEPDKKLILKNFDTTGEIPDGCDIKTDKMSLRIK